jgi:hypothetical protein
MRSLEDTRFWEPLLHRGIRQALSGLSEIATLKIWIAGHSSLSELSTLEHPGFLLPGNHAPLDTEETSRCENMLLAPAHSRDAIVSGRIFSLGHRLSHAHDLPYSLTRRRFFMPKKKSLIRASIEELDTKNAIGQSRFAAKRARREMGETLWVFST